MFVKPANLGSSVGISKAKTPRRAARRRSISPASFDRKIVIEAAVPEAREIECAVLGNDEPEASVPGEVIPSREFYDYEAKYLDDGSQIVIPADARRRGRGRGAAAVDRGVPGHRRRRHGAGRLPARRGATGRIFVNEVNTIPGFTTISMYAKLWAASGVDYPALLDRLIALALERHAEKQQLRTSLT